MKTLSAALHKALTNKYMNGEFELEKLSTGNVNSVAPREPHCRHCAQICFHPKNMDLDHCCSVLQR